MKILILMILAAFLFSCSATPDVDLSQAQAYRIISTSDFSISNRKRVQVIVYSDAARSTFEAKAQTAMKAAVEYQHKSKADVVWVSLVSTPDKRSGFEANAYYYSDGRGNAGSDSKLYWDVRASRGADTFGFKQYNIDN